MDRRAFVGKSIIFSGVGIALQACNTTKSLTSKFVKNPFDIEAVREVVYYAHSDLKMVEQLITKSPHLLNATVDWGDGDFESALGAASHVGNQEIANYLIDQGARMDIFTLAMLGFTDSVIGLIERKPKTLHAIGPHGFTLLHHAAIGVESPELVAFLEEQGLREKFVQTFEK